MKGYQRVNEIKTFLIKITKIKKLIQVLFSNKHEKKYWKKNKLIKVKLFYKMWKKIFQEAKCSVILHSKMFGIYRGIYRQSYIIHRCVYTRCISPSKTNISKSFNKFNLNIWWCGFISIICKFIVQFNACFFNHFSFITIEAKKIFKKKVV